VTQVRRSHARLVLAGYLSLACAIPMLTPAVERGAPPLPPIAPAVLADTSADDPAMQPLHQEASAALQALRAHTARQ